MRNIREIITAVAVCFIFAAVLAEGLIYQLDIEASACEQQK